MQPPSPGRPERRFHWFYALAPYKAGEAIFSILFPLYLLNVQQASLSTVGLLTACVSLTSVPGSVLWGYLSDRWHVRRPYMVLGCVGSALCLGAMGLATSVSHLVVLCLIYGLFNIALSPVSSVLIMETLDEAEWETAFGTFNKIGGWGWVCGLLLGSGLFPLLRQWLPLDLSMRGLFELLALAKLAAAWWLHVSIPESRRWVQRQQFLDGLRHLPALTIIERALYLPRRLLFVMQPRHLRRLFSLGAQPLRRYFLATALLFISSTMVFTLFPLFLQDAIGVSTSAIFLLSLVRMLSATFAYEWVGRWTQTRGPYQVQIWALGGRCLAFLGFVSLYLLTPLPVGKVGVLVLTNVLAGLSWSVFAVAGPIWVGRLSLPGQNGEIMGVYNAIQGVSRIIGAPLGSYLAEWSGYYLSLIHI